MVNRPTVCMPKEMGGMECRTWEDLGRLLPPMAVAGMDRLTQSHVCERKCHATTDRPLFNSSTTTVTVGNGNKARFWHHNWLDGEARHQLGTTPVPASVLEEWDSEPGTMQWQLDQFAAGACGYNNTDPRISGFGLDYKGCSCSLMCRTQF
jgi:hypothetical protein